MATPNQAFAPLAAQLNNNPEWISIVTNNRVGQQQRDQMMQAFAQRNGVTLPKGFHFDPTVQGFVPDAHPLRDGLTVGSLLLGGGALAGGLLGAGAAAPALAPSVTAAAPAAPVSSLSPSILSAAAPKLAPVATHSAHTVGSILGLGGGGFSVGDIVKSALGPAINAGLSVYTTNKQSKLTEQTLAEQTAAEKYQADKQAEAAAAQLKFLQDQEATRKAEFEKTQALNLDQYNQGQARLAPYRNMGQSALSLFGRPIGNVGSILGVA